MENWWFRFLMSRTGYMFNTHLNTDSKYVAEKEYQYDANKNAGRFFLSILKMFLVLSWWICHFWKVFSYSVDKKYNSSVEFKKNHEYVIKSRGFLQRQKVITSKSSSKNLSNKNNHWYFWRLPDKKWIKMPNFFHY